MEAYLTNVVDYSKTSNDTSIFFRAGLECEPGHRAGLFMKHRPALSYTPKGMGFNRYSGESEQIVF